MMVTTICYGEKQHWENRDKAIAYFMQAMAGSEGSEHERYANVFYALLKGKVVCTDGY